MIPLSLIIYATLLTAVSSVRAAPYNEVMTTKTTATPACTSVTMTANYDHLPTGPISPSTNIGGLSYEGWEVVAAEEHPLHAWTKPNYLMTTGEVGFVKAFEPGHKINAYTDEVAGAHGFRFGCANTTSTADCTFVITYGILCTSDDCDSKDDEYDVYFDASSDPHTLQTALGAEYSSVPNITFSLYSTPSNVHLFLDQWIYAITDCE